MIRGTRLTVGIIVEQIACGAAVEAILKDYLSMLQRNLIWMLQSTSLGAQSTIEKRDTVDDEQSRYARLISALAAITTNSRPTESDLVVVVQSMARNIDFPRDRFSGEDQRVAWVPSSTG